MTFLLYSFFVLLPHFIICYPFSALIDRDKGNPAGYVLLAFSVFFSLGKMTGLGYWGFQTREYRSVEPHYSVECGLKFYLVWCKIEDALQLLINRGVWGGAVTL